VEGALLVVAEAVVNLIGDDGYAVLISNGENLEHVLLGEAGTAGVRWVVHEDGLGVGLDVSLHLFKIDIPILVSEQGVSIEFNIQVLANGLAKGEAR